MPLMTLRAHHRAPSAAVLALALTLALPFVTAADAAAAAGGAGTAAPPERAASTSDPAQAAAPSTKPGAARERLTIPRPSGPYAVGRDTLHLVDRSRTDPWQPQAGARELMVSAYYPARHGTGGRTVPYMTRREAEALLEGQDLAGKVPVETVTSVRTNARTDARPVRGRRPLVVLSPGFTLQRTTLTVLAEELAARGYVVAVVDHAWESFGTSFPGGRVTTCAACDAVEEAPDGEGSRAVLAKVASGRSADVSFLIDELTGPRPAWRHARMIDRRSIGVAGHSIGGNSAARLMADDERVRAGVNLDGTFFSPVPEEGLDRRPFLMMGTAAGHSPGGVDGTWDEAWERFDGWRRWLTVEGSGHFTFNDLPVLAGQLGMTDPDTPLPGDRSGQITRAYTGAFFDRHLRGIPQPLLRGPSPANPEVRFHRP
ncbi:Alpha/beta hydrolase family protein [Streptomyces sp. WMMB 714]|nr:Alpha/beta hydrolase family protein [Streptomyces sp. WMMB 714]